MKCPQCFRTLVRDDFDEKFNGCYDEYLVCEVCPVGCILSVRYNRPYKAYWHDESNGVVRDWVQVFTD